MSINTEMLNWVVGTRTSPAFAEGKMSEPFKSLGDDALSLDCFQPQLLQIEENGQRAHPFVAHRISRRGFGSCQ
jgi:hypothetical protein